VHSGRSAAKSAANFESTPMKVIASNFVLLAVGCLAGLMVLCALAEGEPGAQANNEQCPRVNESGPARSGNYACGSSRRRVFPKIPSFEDFCKKFHKRYGSLAERLRRNMLYLGRLGRALQSRAAYSSGTRTDYLGPSAYSDLTDQERARICPPCYETTPANTNDKRPEPAPVESGHRNRATGRSKSSAPIRVDLREGTTGHCLNPIKDQGICHACYAFATVAALEYMFCRHNNNGSVSFSEQYIVDRSWRSGNAGCLDGSISSTAKFSAEWGIHLSDAYPYRLTAAPGSSRFATRPPESTPTPAYRLAAGDVVDVNKTLWPGLLEQSVPVIVATFIRYADFFEHKGGVAAPPCGAGHSGHSMLLIGMDSDTDGPYYIMRNSLGSDWGEHGHYRIRASSDCVYWSGTVLPGLLDPTNSTTQIVPYEETSEMTDDDSNGDGAAAWPVTPVLKWPPRKGLNRQP
jgi:C1A family cysteine protease